MANSDNSDKNDQAGSSSASPAEVAAEASRLNVDKQAYEALKADAEKLGNSSLVDYYDTQIQVIQNEIRRLFGLKPKPWRGG